MTYILFREHGYDNPHADIVDAVKAIDEGRNNDLTKCDYRIRGCPGRWQVYRSHFVSDHDDIHILHQLAGTLSEGDTKGVTYHIEVSH